MEAVKEAAKETVKENIDLVLEYTHKFIESAAPYAQKAYEVGLMTLRIDALGGIVQALFVLAIAGAWIYYAIKKERSFEGGSLYESWHLEKFFPVFASFVALVVGVISLFYLLNVWVWAKLFAPELWLAHQAIEKLVK